MTAPDRLARDDPLLHPTGPRRQKRPLTDRQLLATVISAAASVSSTPAQFPSGTAATLGGDTLPDTR